MFNCAFSFNQPLEQWNVANVTTMQGMFSGANAFHGNAEDFSRPLWTSTGEEDLGRWKVMYKEARRFNALVIGEHVRADRKKTDGSAAGVAVGVVARVLTTLGLAGEISAFLLSSVKD
jgi:surface protein